MITHTDILFYIYKWNIIRSSACSITSEATEQNIQSFPP